MQIIKLIKLICVSRHACEIFIWFGNPTVLFGATMGGWPRAGVLEAGPVKRDGIGVPSAVA